MSALGALDGAPTDVTALLGAGPDVTAIVARKAADARQRTSLSEIVLHAPIPAPSKYLAIGFNFTSHLAEIKEAEGLAAAELEDVALLAVTTLGWPQAIKGLTWIKNVTQALSDEWQAPKSDSLNGLSR